jgi:hypothetical protein
MEECPFCGEQLMGCGCAFKHLGYDDYDMYKMHSGLPYDIYKHGIPPEQQQEWLSILDGIGRVPFINFTHYCCVRCGKPNKEMPMYMVPTWMWWMYVPLTHQVHSAICLSCFKKIKDLIDKRSGLHPGNFVSCPACGSKDKSCEYCRGDLVDERMAPRITKEDEEWLEEGRQFKEAMDANRAYEKKHQKRKR